MLIYFFIFLFGLSVGSFLNVVIFRLEKNKLILFGRSKCPDCGQVLRWHDLIPVLSFVWQKGRCRYCHKKISWQYPLVELAAGTLFLLMWEAKLPTYVGSLASHIASHIYWFTIISFLIVIFVYDLKHYLIPDRVVYPAVIIAFLYSLYQRNPINPIFSALIASTFFLSLVLISKGKWMGWGDVKLAFLMGLVLDWPNVLIALFLAFFSGAVTGIALIISGKKKMKSEIPFGPFLAGSTILLILFDNLSRYF